MSAGDAADRVKQQVEDGVTKAQRQYEEAKRQVDEVQRRADAVPPAEDADEALQQVRDLRGAIDQDLAALEARIPPRDTVLGQLRAVGGAVVGVLGLVGAIATIVSQRKEKQAFEDEADRVARAIARHLPAALAQVAPPVPASSAARPAATPAAEDDDEGGGGLLRVLAILGLLGGAGYAVYAQLKDRRQLDPDLWGPPPAPAPPATPAQPEPTPDETQRIAPVGGSQPAGPPPAPPPPAPPA